MKADSGADTDRCSTVAAQFLRRAEACERDLALDLGGHGVECGTSPSNAAARIGF